MQSAKWLGPIVAKLAGVAIFAVFLMLATMIVMTGPSAEPAARQEKAWPVSVMSATPHTIPPTLVSYGRLESAQQASLETTLNAAVMRIERLEGDWVDQDDLIVQLDDTEARLALDVAIAAHERAQSQLASVHAEHALARELSHHHRELADFAETNLARYRELHAKAMISDSALDEARHQASERAMVLARHLSELADFPNRLEQHGAMVKEARARMQQAELELSQTAVRAPFAGRIIALQVAVGDRVSPGTVLATVADYGQLEIRTSVSAELGQKLRQALQSGQPIIAEAPVGPQLVRFELDRLSANIKPGQSGVDAFFRTALDGSLVIGTVMNLVVSLPAEHEVIALPMQSLYANNRVYRVENNRLHGIEVTRVGDYVDEGGNYRVLVRSPELREGDELMTTQLPVAMTGLLVSPVALFENQADA